MDRGPLKSPCPHFPPRWSTPLLFMMLRPPPLQLPLLLLMPLLLLLKLLLLRSLFLLSCFFWCCSCFLVWAGGVVDFGPILTTSLQSPRPSLFLSDISVLAVSVGDPVCGCDVGFFPGYALEWWLASPQAQHGVAAPLQSRTSVCVVMFKINFRFIVTSTSPNLEKYAIFGYPCIPFEVCQPLLLPAERHTWH